MAIYADGKLLWTNQQQQGLLFKFYCWLALKLWFQRLLIPNHIFWGFYYGYSVPEIIYFCRQSWIENA